MSTTPQPAPAGDTSPPDLLPARMVNEFVYCPRLFYFEFVEGVFTGNADTARGKTLHERVDQGRGDLPPAKPEPHAPDDSPPSETEETIHSRSVSLASERLGVTAKLDLVEITTESGAATRVCPVDYKAGSPRTLEDGPGIWDADRVQLGLQCLLLRDNGYACDEGIIYYRGTRQRVTLTITPDLETWIEAQLAAARRCAAGPLPPPLVDSPKCPRCSLVPICLPDETRLLRESPSFPDDEDPAAPEQVVFPFDGDFPAPRPPPWSLAEAGPRERLRPVRRLIAPRNETKPLYISTPGMALGRKSEIVVVKDKGQVVDEVRIADLDHVAIFGAASITTPLLQVLCEKDIPVTYFSMGGWFYGLTRGHSLKNVFTRIEQFNTAANPAASLAIARRFVHGKIRNQRTLLMRNHVSPPADGIARLRNLASAALEASRTDELLGLEGSAAATYYSAFAGMLKTGDGIDGDAPSAEEQLWLAFDFTRRNRRPPRDAVNALLSFCYALLARDCTIAAVAAGLDPYIGFYHQPRFGRPALALDLMEEFRPLVADSVVISAINNRWVSPRDFVRAGTSINLSPTGRKAMLNAYERRLVSTLSHPVFDYNVSYRRALELQARLLGKTLTGDIPRYEPITTR